MTKPVDLNDEFTKDIFQYLDDLRESGKTNMFGAGIYIERDWGLSREDAHGFVKAWMENFGKEND